MTDLQTLFGLTGRVALVTGAGRGIGEAIARGLAAAGATVILHDKAISNTDKLRESLQACGHRAFSVEGDLSNKGQGCCLIKEAELLTGKIDILVINASAQINANLDQLDDSDLEFQIDVNFRSTVELLQTCLPSMASRGWGRVINIGSINQIRPKAVVTIYAATKAAQHNMIQSQAREYAKSGVLLNTLAPGLIDTERNAHTKEADPVAWANYAEQLNWMGRAGEAEEMVGAALFLASNACSFMTGENLVLSGGY